MEKVKDRKNVGTRVTRVTCVTQFTKNGRNPNISEASREKRREVAKRSGLGAKSPPKGDSVLQI